MEQVHWISDCIVSPLGSTTDKNYMAVSDLKSGVSFVGNQAISGERFFGAELNFPNNSPGFTRFESLCASVIKPLLDTTHIDKNETLFILSTTKGNISILGNSGQHNEKLPLHYSSNTLAAHFGFSHQLVVSNACISGVLSLIIASRYLRTRKFKHALIVGADELSQFVVSGFQSLHALSNNVCKPFDASRDGINLGEAAGAILLSTDATLTSVKNTVTVESGTTTNDANHISGPSRTGAELAAAIRGALTNSGIDTSQIGFLSAHGTATLYNDEMEAKAFHLAGLGHTPVHSLKANFGHTLGAAGIIETIMSTSALQKNELLPTLGFEKTGTSLPLNIIKSVEKKEMNYCLKTASGFGGCNAALVFKKN